ncbi:ABC transporter permease [Amycolatopsis alkalitolerans]|uniref:ABC transporter permease n=1 Tax=Amycolatopsis alkalitolerans TaxID=2547244 RepID=A0A5C4LT92_9PSEU|nr:ABC transporter permease [Amycolatopsis alkalitolerans]TNC20999.1 ABC transporter permease [Amycolatopsis alkalitolerans]
MTRFLVRRIPSALLVLFVTSILAFVLPRLAPGDPAVAMAGPDASAADIAAIRTQLGLDKPLVPQYFHWIGGVFTGDFGQSYATHRPVTQLIGDRLGSTLQLAVLAAVFMVVIGVGLGIAAGSARGRFAKSFLDVLCSLLLAVPAFLTGLVLALLLGVFWRILPVSGEVSLFADPEIGIQYLLLPAFALALPQAAQIARLLQSAMWQSRSEEFVQTAVAKGASSARITVRHVLRNSMASALVSFGMRFGELLGGAVVIEAIFARNGLGALAVTSVNQRDYLVLQTLILFAVAIAVVIQLLTEIALSVLDPRIRLEGAPA